MTTERYRLTLYHELITEDGQLVQLHEPITTMTTMQVSNPHGFPAAVVVNEMLGKLRDYMLDLVRREGW